MKVLFLIAAFNAFFFSVLLLQKKPRAIHDNILILWLVYLGVYISTYAFFSHELFVHFQSVSIILLSLLILHGLFLYHYILTLVSAKKHYTPKDLLHLLPFALFNGYILIASFYPELSVKLNIEKLSRKDDPPLLFLIFLIFTAFSGTIYFLLTLRLFKKLDINIFNNFSNSETIDLHWIRRLVLVFGIVWTVLVTVTVIHHIFNLFSMVFCTDGLFLSLSVFVILIGYFGLKQKVIFASENMILAGSTESNKPKYAGSKLSESEVRQYSQRLVNYMDSAKPFLNPELTLPQLAAETNISIHTLSQVINDHFKLNFFDFVNRYRVEAFKENIVNPKYENFSLLGVAFECGFNSKSAFNRIFKKLTSRTPSQYKDEVLSS